MASADDWVTVEVRLPRQHVRIIDQLGHISGLTRPAYIRWMIEMLLHNRTYLALFSALIRKPEPQDAVLTTPRQSRARGPMHGIAAKDFVQFVFSEAAARRIATIRVNRAGLSVQDIEKMLVVQEGKCAYCGNILNESFEVEHRLPRAHGGTDDPENLCCACIRCNRAKGTMTVEEFMQLLDAKDPTM